MHFPEGGTGLVTGTCLYLDHQSIYRWGGGFFYIFMEEFCYILPHRAIKNKKDYNCDCKNARCRYEACGCYKIEPTMSHSRNVAANKIEGMNGLSHSQCQSFQ